MTDHENWLAAYVQTRSDAAFGELVSHYVDLVYSTALRLVSGDPHRAEDIAQTVFLKLARVAPTLPRDVQLGGWLHRDTCFTASTLLRGERRRQSRERTAAEMNALQTDSDFSYLAPILDEAINELGEADRTAILLRFYEEYDFRAVGQALGSNEDAARMRVTRALEKLQSFLKQRGVVTTAASLAAALSGNAVQAAPAGLAAAVATAAGLASTTVALAITKAIAMTTLQKTLAAAAALILLGIGSYEALLISRLREQNQALQQQQAPLAEQIVDLNQAFINATNQLAALRDDNERLNRNTGELLKLRGELGLLRREPNSEQNQQRQSEKTEGEWIKSVVYFGNDDQIKLWRSRGPAGIQILVRALRSPAYDHSTRMCVASLISQLKDDARSAIPDLVSMLKTEKDDSVRAILIGYFEGQMQELGEHERSEMLPELIRGLENGNTSVRNNSLLLLQYYTSQSEVVVPLMAKALQDSSPGVRVMAVRALEKIDPRNSAGIEQVAVLAGCLTGPKGDTPDAPGQAAIMLGELQREPDLAIPALIQGLQNPASYVRENSAAALGKFGGQARPALDALAKALADSDNNVRSQASSAIALINSAPSPK